MRKDAERRGRLLQSNKEIPTKFKHIRSHPQIDKKNPANIPESFRIKIMGVCTENDDLSWHHVDLKRMDTNKLSRNYNIRLNVFK